MHSKTWLIAAAAFIAAPAAANTNAAAPPAANTANETAVTDVNAVSTAAPATNAFEPAPAPAASDVSTRAANNGRRSSGFPYGLIGLVGLIGLLGRRRAS